MMTLYHFEGSPFCWMARAALAEKGLKYETMEPRDRETNPALRKLNPINRTPTLVDGGESIFESFAILEYLDEKYPQPPLMPKDPAARARARAMALLGYLYLFPDGRIVSQQLFEWEGWDYRSGLYPPRRPAEKVDQSLVGPAEDRLMASFRILDQELAGRPWATGDAFGIADIVLAPAAAGFKLRGRPIQEFRAVAKWLESCLARPSIRDAATPAVKAGKPI